MSGVSGHMMCIYENVVAATCARRLEGRGVVVQLRAEAHVRHLCAPDGIQKHVVRLHSTAQRHLTRINSSQQQAYVGL